MNTAHHDAQPPLQLADAYRFFLPLVFMTELNMISKSVIHAFLARVPQPSATLAAFNTSFTFYFTITSATEVTTFLSLSYLQSRRSLPRLFAFMALVLAAPIALAELIAFTPLGEWLYGEVFGASARATEQAQIATFIFSLSAPILLLRATAFSLLMLNRRTLLITASTLVRLFSLALSLLVLPAFLSGAAIGAGALITCMVFETCFAWMFAWRHWRELPAEAPDDWPEFTELWRFAWPLILNQMAEMGVIFVINLFLGRLQDPDLALAAFGVVHGLVGLLMSPMRNLVQTAQTLAHTARDRAVLTRFSLQLIAFFAILAAVLFHTPASGWVLDTVMGLEPRMSAYCAVAMKLAFAMSLFWSFAALYRGLLARQRTTKILATTGAMRVAATCVIGAITLVKPEINGALLGLVAWILSYAVEAGLLRWRLSAADGSGTIATS